MSEQEGNLISRFVFGPNIVVLNGAAWKKHRQIANPAFQRAMPVRLFAELSHTMFKVMDREVESGPVEIHDVLVRWTLQVLGLSMFGFDFDALENEGSTWVKRYNNINRSLFDMKYIFFPFLDRYCLSMLPKRRAVHDELTQFLQFLESIIDQKRAALEKGTKDASVPDSERDLLELMLESEQTTRGKLTNEELLSDLCVFFMAGHESTANALSFAIYYLAVHPDVQEKARQEAIDHFGDGNEDIFPTAEETKNMPYLNAVIKETLRIAPPATSILVRHLTEEMDIGGTVYPRQTRVVFDIHEMHHNPKYWSDPDVFKPDRFLPGGEAEQLAAKGDSMAWNPFSNGARQCIGANFSLAEQRIMLPLLCKFTNAFRKYA
ncbi:cytochrome P450 [Syncephalastrum racemosum]|uniref:Cytochrome P450 n=1 Tax=Syncephalastrum racemosum TaxID=13706 RepID=A0A1X2HC07_SYNRA|nr:cytochrome P450 [Syncephalastrum racemosum]